MRLRNDKGKQETLKLDGPGGKLRFGVGNPMGERASVWVIEAGRNTRDVYLGNRDMMSFQKISLHQSGVWRFAWTEEKAPLFLSAGENRLIDSWSRPPELGAGWTLALRIWVPEEDVATVAKVQGKAKSLKAINWVPRPPPSTAIVFQVVIARPDQGEVHLKDSVPLAGFTLATHNGNLEACLVLLSSVPVTSENRLWLDETRGRVFAEAQTRGVDLGTPTIRAAAYGYENDGTRSLWDFSVVPVSSKPPS